MKSAPHSQSSDALLDRPEGWTGEEDYPADVCIHGKPFDVICVECCPEDDDGSFTGDEWSEG